MILEDDNARRLTNNHVYNINFHIDVKAQMLSFQQNSLVQAQHIVQAELPFTVGKLIITSILLYTTIMKNCVL